MTASRPAQPWRVITSKGGAQLAETPHTSENKAFEHVRRVLRAEADTAKVMQWSDGRWWHFETLTADDLPEDPR